MNEFYNSELLYDSGVVEGSPLFSVCLSTYNFEKSVELALQTLICQTFEDYEIVIHDDASKDRTCEAVLNMLNASKIGGG